MSTRTSSLSIRTTLPRHDVALLEGDDGGVVVGDDLAVDLDQEAVRARRRSRGGWVGVSICCTRRAGSDRTGTRRYGWYPRPRCRRGAPSAAPSAPRWAATTTSLICGASFAGLAVARELAGTRRARAGARPLRDRRAPDLRLRHPHRVARGDGPEGSHRQTFGELVVHTPHGTSRWPAALDLLDVRLPRALRAALGPVRRRVRDRQGQRAHAATRSSHRPRRRDRAADRRRARLAADAAATAATSRPTRPLSRGLEVHPGGAGEDLEIWIDRRYVPAGLRLELPGAATSCGSASAPSTRASTSRTPPSLLAEDLERDAGPLPGQLDPAQAARRRPRTASSSSATRPATACR